MNNKDIAKIVEEVQKDPDKNFDLLYKSTYKTVYIMAFSYLKNKEDAEDITQEIFVKIYNNISSLKNPAAFNSWMNRIISNSCYRALEYKKKTNGNLSIDDGDSYKEYENTNRTEIPELHLELKDTHKTIIENINELPVKISEVLMMYYFQELKVKTIAEILDIDEATVKSRLFQGRKKLRLSLMEFYTGLSKLPVIFFGQKFIGSIIGNSFGEVAGSSAAAASGTGLLAFLARRFNDFKSSFAGVVAAGLLVLAIVAGATLGAFNLVVNRNRADKSSVNCADNQKPVEISEIKKTEDPVNKPVESPVVEFGFIGNGDSNDIFSIVDNTSADNSGDDQSAGVGDDQDNSGGEDDVDEDEDQDEEEIILEYNTYDRFLTASVYNILKNSGRFLTRDELDIVLDLQDLKEDLEALELKVDTYHQHEEDDNSDDDHQHHYWRHYHLINWDLEFKFSYKKHNNNKYEYEYSIAQIDNTDSLLNIDLNADGLPDINIDLDKDGLPDLNIDLDNDGKADLNLDIDSDGYPEKNVDIDGDWLADLNIL